MKRCLPKMWRSHTSLGESRHHWQRQHHLPKANIIEKSQVENRLGFFLGRGGRTRSRRYDAKPSFDFGFATRLRSFAALTVHRTVIHYRSPSSPPQIVSQQKEKAHEKIVDFIFLAGAGGLEPATHGFGVAPKYRKALKLLTFSRVSTHFSHKTTCRNCVWKSLMLF